MMIVTAQQLIEHPRAMRPHVVLLGSGASRAAFPNGDATGRAIRALEWAGAISREWIML